MCNFILLKFKIKGNDKEWFDLYILRKMYVENIYKVCFYLIKYFKGFF